jgi:3(or 17)beta-hydroxysteroid dehydrogenase
MRLANKVALVTGAARGIGKAIGELFHSEAAHVIFSDILDAEGQAVVARFSERADYHHLDVREEAEWAALCSIIKETHGGLDILINNAGVSGLVDMNSPSNPEGISLEDWRAVHAVNLDGVMLGCKHAIRAMKTTGGGSIVNISSRSGMIGVPMLTAYASSKAAVRNHTKSVSLHCAEQGYNIRCNSIHPGLILTNLWDPILGTGPEREAAIGAIARDIPLGAMGTPEDVAYAALYLASDEARYATGIELTIDGGILAGSAATPTDEDA